MKKYYKTTLLLVLGTALVSCGGGDSAPPISTINTAVIADGKTFYMNECSGCHSAGSDDTSTAFNSSNLYKDQDLIKPDLSEYGASNIAGVTTLMGRFTNLSDKRVADLKAYLKSL